ncbi:MAG: hypothetical protein ACRDSP_13415 [Pseudonocardiaceae bacterium]
MGSAAGRGDARGRQARRLEEAGLAVVDTVPADETFVVIDGYHGFMALPTDLAPIADRAFLPGRWLQVRHGRRRCLIQRTWDGGF